MSVVIDASITIAWLFDDEKDDAAIEMSQHVALKGAVVPSLWRLEVANVLRYAERRGRCEQSYVDASLSRLARLRIEIDDSTNDRAWDGTLKLARDNDLTVYDAAYLELALRRNLPLATRDKDLIAAAKRHHVPVP